MTENQQKDDYKDTLFLPTTDFPMRAGLPQKEPEILKQWWETPSESDDDTYQTLMKKTTDRARYILHWGPPFANGHLHVGHVLTYVLKDVVIRSQFMLGKQAPSVTGWDCHGLPIEWKVEEQFRKDGKNKDDVSPVKFREQCRAYAKKWKDIQSAEMKRLGILADWDNPYLTMDFKSEAAIAAEVHKFVEKNMIYQALRPVMWSVPERTALAEFEVEYKEHKSTAIFVGFDVVQASTPALEDCQMIIWTTTPWTIPANRMIAVGDDVEYGVYQVKSYNEDAKQPVAVGKKMVVATDLWESVSAQMGIDDFDQLATLNGCDLVGSSCAHPFREEDDYYSFDVPVLSGDFVTTEAGTGCVHCAPSHGMDDFILGKKHGITPEDTVLDNGLYSDKVGLFGGTAVLTEDGKDWPANWAVLKKLAEVEKLHAKQSYKHDYPHSWRSKAPVIFRATPQWYIELDKSGLRETALNEIKKTEWFPAQSEKRITAMIEGRPDWCISRQRTWGVPIAIFVHKETSKILSDPAVLKRTIDLFNDEGADAWYGRDPQDFLGDAYKADDFNQVRDVIDVWFESGSTHAFVCEAREDLTKPLVAQNPSTPQIDLYLEGSDQHRGWFQSSLLQSCGSRGHAPYKQVSTNGFVLDKDGRKMSKSLGNVIDPMKLIDQYGADIIRLWVMGQDYHTDVRVSQESIKLHTDTYRRFRNTLRYVLGGLDGFNDQERVDLVADYDKLPSLEKWVLHRLTEIDRVVREKMSRYAFHDAYKEIHDFCNIDLSAFYFDIRKDRLYCDRPDLYERRVMRCVLEVIFDCLTTWLAPFIPFTMEETWSNRPEGVLPNATEDSVHYRTYADIPPSWHNPDLAKQWQRIRKIRSVVTGAIEVERAEKRIRSSLEAHPTLYLNAEDKNLTDAMVLDWAEIAITSQLTVVTDAAPDSAFTESDINDVAVVVSMADGQKCARSWKILPDVGSVTGYPDLTPRDADAVAYLRKQKAA